MDHHPVLLEKEDDELLVMAFKDNSHTTFWIQLYPNEFYDDEDEEKKACHEISVENDTWVFVEGRRNFNSPIKIVPNNIKKIKLSKGKIAIVTHTEERKGKNQEEYKVYQVDRYNVKEDGRLKLRTENGAVVLYLIAEDGEERKQDSEMLVYDESTSESGMDRTLKVSQIIGNLGKFGSFITGIVFAGIA